MSYDGYLDYCLAVKSSENLFVEICKALPIAKLIEKTSLIAKIRVPCGDITKRITEYEIKFDRVQETLNLV